MSTNPVPHDADAFLSRTQPCFAVNEIILPNDRMIVLLLSLASALGPGLLAWPS